MWLNIYSHYL